METRLSICLTKESEPILKAILSNLFFNVYPVSSLNDAKFINSKNISYIFIPEIETDSSSRSIWIWPPSDFTVTLSCKAIDPSGEMTWKTTVNSEAHLGLPAVHKDFSLAGKVAITQAFSKLRDEIHRKFYDQNTDSYYYSPQGGSYNLQEELADPIDSFNGQDHYSLPPK